MSDYSYTGGFAGKDALASGTLAKRILGTDVENQFTAVETAVNSKADKASPTFTGTVTAAAVTASGLVTVNGNRLTVQNASQPKIEFHHTGGTSAAGAIMSDSATPITIYTTNGGGTLGSQILKFNTSGYMTVPFQPRVYATRSTTQTSGTTVVFTTEGYDNVGAYDNTTGIFTAPVTGMYQIAANVTLYHDTTAYPHPSRQLTLWVGSSGWHYAVSSLQDESYTSFALSHSVYLTAGQTSYLAFDAAMTSSIYVSAATYSATLLH
jgi:hypothetical protein